MFSPVNSVGPLRRIRSSALALVLAALAGCGSGSDEVALRGPSLTAPPRASGDALRSAIATQDSRTDLLALPGVVGTGISLDAQGRPVLLVLLDRAHGAELPSRIGELPVVAEAVGPIRPFALSTRYRPVPIGVSAGNANECLPGTIGCMLERGGKRYMLSANHVFARQNQASLGEAILQPSLPDVDPACAPARPSMIVGELSDFEPVVYDAKTPNRMDAAIAEVTADESICATLPVFYGLPSSQTRTPFVGLSVLKVGRTTELTRGTIKAINVKVKIGFPSGVALFVDQILTSKGFGAFGDSGSLMVTDDGQSHPVGMVIGGSANGSAIASPIDPILERFGASICGN